MQEVTDPALLAILNGAGQPPIGPTLSSSIRPDQLETIKEDYASGGGGLRTFDNPTGAQPLTPEGLMEVTDPKLLAELNKEPGNKQPDNIPWLLKALASFGTGAATGAAGIIKAPYDMSAFVQRQTGGTPTGGIGDPVAAVKEYMYQPEGRAEKDIAGAGSALPLALMTGNPVTALASMVGGGLGEDATNWNAFKNINPEYVRAAGNIAIPSVMFAAQNAPAIAKAAWHLFAPDTSAGGHAALSAIKDAVGRIISGSKKVPSAEPIPSPTELYAMGQTGEKSSAELERLATANRQRVWGPDEPVIGSLPEIPESIRRIVWALQSLVGQPIVQSEAAGQPLFK